MLLEKLSRCGAKRLDLSRRDRDGPECVMGLRPLFEHVEHTLRSSLSA